MIAFGHTGETNQVGDREMVKDAGYDLCWEYGLWGNDLRYLQGS